MPQTLVRHGSNSGYKAELAKGEDPCNRCRKARRVFQTQYTKAGKAKGIKYKSHEVIDHLYGQQNQGGPKRTSAVTDRNTDYGQTPVSGPSPAAEPLTDETGPDHTRTLGDRLGDALGGLRMPGGDNPYVSEDDTDGYVHEVDPDPEPADGEWSAVTDDEFVVNAAGLKKIEDNLGTYLSVVGMTMEMVDPYCGAKLSANFENIVSKWSKVISHYPAAAKLFLDGKSGVVFAWIGAIQATWPVLYAIYEHHLSKTVRVKDGMVYRRQGGTPENGNVDSTMPPMSDGFNYTVN
jgi:hypothetical protein